MYHVPCESCHLLVYSSVLRRRVSEVQSMRSLVDTASLRWHCPMRSLVVILSHLEKPVVLWRLLLFYGSCQYRESKSSEVASYLLSCGAYWTKDAKLICVRAVFGVKNEQSGMTILDMGSSHVVKHLARSQWATSSIDMCRLLLFFLFAAH
jgi:hypothetical protein